MSRRASTADDWTNDGATHVIAAELAESCRRILEGEDLGALHALQCFGDLVALELRSQPHNAVLEMGGDATQKEVRQGEA